VFVEPGLKGWIVKIGGRTLGPYRTYGEACATMQITRRILIRAGYSRRFPNSQADLGSENVRGFEPPALGSRMQCSQLRRGQPRQLCLSSDLRKADTAQEILKTRVGAERIEGWP